MATHQEKTLNRIRWLASLIKQHGGSAEFVRSYDQLPNETPVTENYLNQIIGGHKSSFGEKSAGKIARFARLPENFFDLPFIDDDELTRESMVQAAHAGLVAAPQSYATFEVLDVRAACGDGYINEDYPLTVSSIRTSLEYAQNVIGSTNKSGHVKLFEAYDESMKPTILNKDLILVDVSCNEMRGEGVYLLLHAGGLSCKRLNKPGKRIVVCADNKDIHYEPWFLDEDSSARIVGKVLDSITLTVKRHGV